eukprot:COSAG02_NODE_12221_length_1578_cov_1.334686_1_plen_63_part_00
MCAGITADVPDWWGGGRGQSAPITALDCVILVAVRAEVSDDALAVAEGSGGMEAGDNDKQEL